MECLHKLYRKVKGQEYMLPCGQCIACRLNRAHEWSIRIMHELKMHNGVGCFVTLTYNQENAPWVSDFQATLVKRDLQLFFKRLRKELSYDNIKIRYYAVGEYGDTYKRPHYHCIIFGLDEARAEVLVDKCWLLGFVHIGSVTMDSANYVARYCTKLLTGPKKEWYKERNIVPEFSVMSRKPGIGASWLEKYGKEVKTHHNVVMKGKEFKPPRYYVEKVYDEVDRRIVRDSATDFIIAKARQLAEDLRNGRLAQDRIDTREKTILSRLKKRKG